MCPFWQHFYCKINHQLRKVETSLLIRHDPPSPQTFPKIHDQFFEEIITSVVWHIRQIFWDHWGLRFRPWKQPIFTLFVAPIYPAFKINYGPPTANLWSDWSPQKRVNRDKLDQRQKVRKSRFLSTVLLITPLSTRNHHSKSVEFGSNFKFSQICQIWGDRTMILKWP